MIKRDQDYAKALAANGGEMTKHQLASVLRVGKGTAWDRLVAMEKRGYVTRRAGVGPQDPAVFTLTDSGRALSVRRSPNEGTNG